MNPRRVRGLGRTRALNEDPEPPSEEVLHRPPRLEPAGPYAAEATEGGAEGAPVGLTAPSDVARAPGPATGHVEGAR